MKEKQLTTIKCPKCNYEYLPAEIFYPDSLLGKPKDIIRADSGKIEFFSGDDADLREDFTCDNCGAHFVVVADITFTSHYDSNLDFSEDYETVIYKDRIKLEEPK